MWWIFVRHFRYLFDEERVVCAHGPPSIGYITGDRGGIGYFEIWLSCDIQEPPSSERHGTSVQAGAHAPHVTDWSTNVHITIERVVKVRPGSGSNFQGPSPLCENKMIMGNSHTLISTTWGMERGGKCEDGQGEDG